MTERYKTQRTQGGAVVQAGLNVQPRGMDTMLRPKLGKYRGIVTEVFMPQDEQGVDVPENFRKFQVECDVILIRSQLHLRRVPVMQPQYGVNNAQPWIPKASTRAVSTGEPPNFQVRSARGSFGAQATDFGDLDGDMVLVEFVEGLIDFPVVVGALTHEQANRLIRKGTGWVEGQGAAQRGIPQQHEYYLHHKGAEVRINDDGEILMDTVGAYTDITTEDASTAKGDVRVRIKGTQRLTVAMGDDEDTLEVWKDGNQLRIDLGEGASERLVLGDAFRTFLNNFLATEFDTHIHSTGTGPSGPPGVPSTKMGTDVLSDLAKTKKT